MPDFRITLTPGGPWLTPWHADTVFGHLCWILAYTRGEDALTGFLEQMQSPAPPLVLSDGFPGGLLPAPIWPARQFPRSDAPLARQTTEFRANREAGKAAWLTADQFALAITGSSATGVAQRQLTTVAALRNTIDRATGSTLQDGGGLYSLIETWPGVPTSGPRPTGAPPAEPDPVVVYARIDNEAVDTTLSLFRALQPYGFGKRRSAGYGTIRGVTVDEWQGFPEPAQPDCVVLLSHTTPAATDPVDGQWRLTVKYGKLGEAANPNPFKNPVLQLEPGSVLRTAQPRPWYGRMVSGIAPGDPRALQYSIGYAVAARLPTA